MIRNALKYVFVCFGLLFSMEISAQEKPNVLFIAIDDLNDWSGCQQNFPNVQTPNIDRLASSGILFNNAHCQAPLCGPSRASIMTGLLPSTTGIYAMIDDDKIKECNETTNEVIFLPDYFEQFGYKTMGIGKLFHLGDKAKCFQEYGGVYEMFGPKPQKRFKYDPAWFGKPSGTSTDWGAYPVYDSLMPDDKYANWAIERLKQKHDQPFFLAVGFIRPHVPWYVPQKWFDLFSVDQMKTPPFDPDDMNDISEFAKQVMDVPPMPTTEWAIENNYWQEIVQAYLACMAFTDYQVGRVLDALENSEYKNNTIIVLWSDHGYHLGEKNRFAKHSLWRRATHVPLIFAGPGIKVSQKSEIPAGLIDIYPTLAGLCKLPPNPKNEGVDLFSILHDPVKAAQKCVITTYGFKNHSVYWDDWHYIHYKDGSEELYNLKNDSNEWENIASKDEYSEIKLKMKQKLPEVNLSNVPQSSYNINEYFRENLNDL